MNHYIGWQLFDYYEWLLEKIDGHMEPFIHYGSLLSELHSIPFSWSLDRDMNLAVNGEQLRWEFMDERNVADIFYKDGIKCSVLEMLIALSVRCDNDIMGVGDRSQAGKWFWIMIENLDLMHCTDDNFDPGFVERQIDIWLSRSFDRKGNGSPFPLKKAIHDQRKVEIWRQMCGYLSENYWGN